MRIIIYIILGLLFLSLKNDKTDICGDYYGSIEGKFFENDTALYRIDRHLHLECGDSSFSFSGDYSWEDPSWEEPIGERIEGKWRINKGKIKPKIDTLILDFISENSGAKLSYEFEIKSKNELVEITNDSISRNCKLIKWR